MTFLCLSPLLSLTLSLPVRLSVCLFQSVSLTHSVSALCLSLSPLSVSQSLYLPSLFLSSSPLCHYTSLLPFAHTHTLTISLLSELDLPFPLPPNPLIPCTLPLLFPPFFLYVLSHNNQCQNQTSLPSTVFTAKKNQ